MASARDPSDHPVLSSIGDFLLAGLRPRTPLAKAIVLVLVIKLAIVVSFQAYLLVSRAQPDVNAASMRHVLDPANSQKLERSTNAQP